MDEPNFTTWQQFAYERERDREPRNEPLFESYLYSRLEDFLRFYREDQYEFEFREDFIQLVVSKYFTHWIRERNLFDIVAFRIYQDMKEEPSFHERYRDPDLWDTRLFWGYGHLVGFELKTAHDDAYRFLDQLPRYAWLFDRVYLVLARDVPIPSRIPAWVGVMKYMDGGEFAHVKKPTSTQFGFLGRRGVGFGKSYLPNYKGQNSPSFGDFMSFLRKIVINGLFKENVIPFTAFDRGCVDLLEFLDRKDNETINLTVLQDLVKFIHKEDRGTRIQKLISEYGKMDSDG